MKKFNNIFLYLLTILAMVTVSCEEDKVLPTISDDPSTFVSPGIENAASSSAAVTLNFEDAETIWETFTWTAADYGVNIPVKYSLQVDAEGGDFSDPVILASDLSATEASVTVSQINGVVLSKGLEPFEEVNLILRIVGDVQGQGVEVAQTVSATITRTVVGYVTEFGPIWMIGAGVGGWDWGLAVEVNGIGPSEWEVTAQFLAEGDANFRFFEVFNDWASTNYNYPFFDTVDPIFENANDGDSNFKFVGTTGFYRININLKTKTVSVVESLGPDVPALYLVGAGVPDAGWSWDTPVNLTWVKDGVFEGETNFLNGEAFRMFTINGDWNSGLNFPHYLSNEYEIADVFEDAQDGDNNFRFTGESGLFKITVNDIEKKITMASAGTAGPPKYLVGDGTDAGWDWTTPVELVQVEAGVFVGTTSFFNAGAFRVFTTNGDWNSGINYPTYISNGYTISADFEDAMDGDNNFKFIGAESTYKFEFTLDDNNKEITVKLASVGDPYYLVGDGTSAGWDWTTPVELVQVEDGVFLGTTAFNTAGAFRVFTINGDWNSGINYPTYVADGFTVDSNFTDAMDGDNNFKFTGTDGTFDFKVDNNAKTITLQ